MNFFAKRYLPVLLQSLIRDVKAKVNDKVSIRGNDEDFNCVGASLASSCNYLSPAYTDKDAFISFLMFSLEMSTLGNYKNTQRKWMLHATFISPQAGDM